MKWIMALAVAACITSGCDVTEVQWWLGAPDHAREDVVRHIVYTTADEYGVDPELMMRIARCESGLRPWAVNKQSGAAGLFQHLPRYWAARADSIGEPGANILDPWPNARAAAAMLAAQGTRPWLSSVHCWG